MSGRFRGWTWLFAIGLPFGLAWPAGDAAATDGGLTPFGVASPSPSPFESEIQAFEHADKQGPQPRHPIVFIGSSSIRMWTTLRQDFPRQRVLNRGFGGSHISDSVDFVERIVVPYAPSLVIMYAGGNDIDAGKTPAVVAADFQAFTARVWSRLPHTEIAFISIAPNPARWGEVDRVREANRLIAAACDSDRRLHFIDVFPRMLGDDGQPRAELFVGDHLHMNHKGYEVWIPLVRQTIDAVIGSGTGAGTAKAAGVRPAAASEKKPPTAPDAIR